MLPTTREVSGEYKELCHSGVNLPSPDFPEMFGVVDRSGKMELKMAKNHDFNFDGGEYLTSMGATWFVSYSFHSLRDKTHKNWERVKTQIIW